MTCASATFFAFDLSLFPLPVVPCRAVARRALRHRRALEWAGDGISALPEVLFFLFIRTELMFKIL
eukprot:8700698-Pyramimonas_sp.AAC.1